jgi:IS5 family transposase
MDSADLKNGYDWTKLREKLHAGGVRLLIEHRTFRLVDHGTTRGSMGLATAN